MTIVTKGTNPSARPYGRGATFVSGTDFVVDDIIDLEYSFGGAPASVTVEAAAGASCTFRLNSLNRRYPLLETAKSLGYPAPDLQKEATWTNADAPSYTLAAEESIDLTSPVANLEFTAISGTITVKARA